jgi:hypothetical protein
MKAYEDALLDGQFAQAWSMVGPESQACWTTLETYREERSLFLKSSGTQYIMDVNPSNEAPLADWVGMGFQCSAAKPSIDMANAVLIRVTWKKLANNNAGWEMWVVNPAPGGWILYEVR